MSQPVSHMSLPELLSMSYYIWQSFLLVPLASLSALPGNSVESPHYLKAMAVVKHFAGYSLEWDYEHNVTVLIFALTGEK